MLIGVFSTVRSQTNDSTYQQYLLNNHNVPKRIYYTKDIRNVVKTDLVSILDGVLPIIWEHRFSESIVLDGGVGLIMPYSIIDVFGYSARANSNNGSQNNLLGYNQSFDNDKFGTSVHLEPKLYFSESGSSIDSNSNAYMSLFYDRKAYDRLGMTAFGAAYGYEIDYDKISLDLSFAIYKVKQNAFSDYNDFKFTAGLSERNGTTAESLRLSLRCQIGFQFDALFQSYKITNK